MAGEAIKQALDGAIEYLTAHPEEARYRDGAATATLRGGLLVDVAGSGGEAITTDMVTAVGGTGSAPSPGWLFRAAAASCVTTLIAMRAALLGLKLDSIQLIVDSESDDRGILAIDPSVPAGPISVRVEAAINATGSDPVLVRELVAWAVAHCPVTDAIGRAVPMEVVVTGSGR